MAKKGWSDEEKKYLNDNYNSMSLNDIAKNLHKTYYAVWRYAKLYLMQTTQTTTTTPEGQEQITTTRKPVLKVNITPSEDGLYFEVQTNEEFENYLSSTKQIRHTENLFGQGQPGDFYLNALFRNNMVDDANADIIVGNRTTAQINMAVLRIKGIKDGIKVKTSRLVTETQLRKMVKKFMQDYKDFYKMTINRINISGVLYEDTAQPARRQENV